MGMTHVLEMDKVVSIGNLDLCQTHCKQAADYLRVIMSCALAIVFQVHSLYVPTRNRLPSWNHFLESVAF